MNKNILLCGVGGQGTVLASKIMAAAAMAKNLSVMTAETIGMAQRGGSVFSHVRFGDNLHSPLIAKGKADIIIGFEPSEAVRMLSYLRQGGTVVVSSHPMMPVTAALAGSDYNGTEMIDYLKKKVKHLVVIDSEKVCEDLKSPKVLNIVLLGAAVRTGELGLDETDIKEAIINKVPAKFHELNLKALEYYKK